MISKSFMKLSKPYICSVWWDISDDLRIIPIGRYAITNLFFTMGMARNVGSVKLST